MILSLVLPFLIYYAPVTLIIILSVLFGIAVGVFRGLSRQVVRFVTILVSAIIAFVGTRIAYNSYVSSITPEDLDAFFAWLEGMIPNFGSVASGLEYLDFNSRLLIVQIPLALVVAPIVFVVAFAIIKGLMMLIHLLFVKILHLSEREKTTKSRMWGMALGVVQGLVVACVLVTPIVGIGNAFSSTVVTLQEQSPENEVTISLSAVHEKIEFLAKDPCYLLLSKFGVNALYDGVSSAKVDGKSYNTSSLLPDAALLVGEAQKLSNTDFKNLTSEDEAVINNMLDTVEDNPLLTKVLSDTIRNLANNYKDGTISIPVQSPYDSILDSAIAIFETTDSSNVHADLDTVLEVLMILSREGVLSSLGTNSEALLTALTTRDGNGQTAVNKIIDTVSANTRTKPLVSMLAKLSVTIMSQQAGIDPGVVDTYDNIKDSINNDILSIDKEEFETEEEYVEAVTESLDTVLKENQIEVEPEIVETMAEYIAENFSDLPEITDDDINDIILSYYDAYLEYLENGTIPDGVGGLLP